MACFAVVNTAGSQGDSLTIGSQAPGIFLQDLKGQDFFLSDYCGQARRSGLSPERYPVVIGFFTTWCAPCLIEIPLLEKLADEYPGIKFFLIDVKEEREITRTFIREKQFALPVLLDKYGRIAARYYVNSLPALYIIDKQGMIVHAHKGVGPDFYNSIKQILLNVGTD